MARLNSLDISALSYRVQEQLANWDPPTGLSAFGELMNELRALYTEKYETTTDHERPGLGVTQTELDVVQTELGAIVQTVGTLQTWVRSVETKINRLSQLLTVAGEDTK